MPNLIVIQKPTQEETQSKRKKWYHQIAILKLNDLDTYCGNSNAPSVHGTGAWGNLKCPGILSLIHKSYIKFQNHEVLRTIRPISDVHTLAGFIALEYSNFVTTMVISRKLNLLISIDEFRAWSRYVRLWSRGTVTLNVYWIDLTRETFVIEAPLQSQKIVLNLKELEDEVSRDYEIGRCTGVWARPYFTE